MAVTRLRYVDCILPTGLERSVLEFEDYFDDLIKPYFDQLDALKKKHLQNMLDALDTNIKARSDLCSGAPVKELGSLSAMEDSTKLTNPERDPNDKKTIRLDEMKLAAAGIVMINGRLFKLLPGGKRIQDLRYLWDAAGGDYPSFIGLGDAIAGTGIPVGSCLFLAHNPVTKRFPYSGKSPAQVQALSGYHTSLFRYRLFWTKQADATPGNYSKLNSYGFDSEQTSDIFSGSQPTISIDLNSILVQTGNYIKILAKLLLLPTDDPLKQPAWKNEADMMESAIISFLNWRVYKYTTSSLIDPDFWESVKINLSKADMVELFENRPDVSDMEVPTAIAEITRLINAAITSPPGTTINTYMINMAGNLTKYEEDTKNALFNLGLDMWQVLSQTLPERANYLETLLQYLTGSLTPLSQANRLGSDDEIDSKDLKSVFSPTVKASATDLKAIVDTLGKNPNGTQDAKIKDSIKAASTLDAQTSAELKETSSENVKTGEAAGSTNTQGLTTKETFAMILARRTKWGEVDMSCFGTRVVNRSDPNAESGSSSKVVDAKTGEVLGSTDDNQFTKDGVTYTGRPDIDPQTGAVTQPQTIGTDTGELTPDKYAAKDRRTVERSGGAPPNQYNSTFDITCSSSTLDEFGRRIEALRKTVEPIILQVIEILKEIIVYIQDRIDSFILAFQLILDQVLGKLEKLLTLDVNFSGKTGFDGSLIKCAWGLDFGLKLNLLSFILALLQGMFDAIGAPLTDFLNNLKDFLTNIFCIPIRLLESIMSNPLLQNFLRTIGCTMKDIHLPDAILDLLKLLQASFDLRSIVLGQASSDWLDLTSGIKKQGNEWQGLSQFASVCNNPPMANMVSEMEDVVAVSATSIPINANSKTLRGVTGTAVTAQTPSETMAATYRLKKPDEAPIAPS